METNSPARCLSDYGVMLGEEAIPFVIAYDLVANLEESVLTEEEAAAVGLALLRSLAGSRRSGDCQGAASFWGFEARAEVIRQRI
jgi:hypothetical protein